MQFETQNTTQEKQTRIYMWQTASGFFHPLRLSLSSALYLPTNKVDVESTRVNI